MVKIIEARKAIDDCDKKITAEVKKGTGRDKKAIRRLQLEHDRLTTQLATLLRANREEPHDAKDNTSEVYRKEQADKSLAKKEEFEKKQKGLEVPREPRKVEA